MKKENSSLIGFKTKVRHIMSIVPLKLTLLFMNFEITFMHAKYKILILFVTKNYLGRCHCAFYFTMLSFINLKISKTIQMTSKNFYFALCKLVEIQNSPKGNINSFYSKRIFRFYWTIIQKQLAICTDYKIST